MSRVYAEPLGYQRVAAGRLVYSLKKAHEYTKMITVGGQPEACDGSCNNDSEVTVNEIITMVNIALGESPITSCEADVLNGCS